MFTSVMPNPKQQFFDNNGLPLINGKVYTYDAGTTNPKATYVDESGTVAQANPVLLNTRGEPASTIRWSGAYRVDVFDSLNNLVYSVDDFQSPVSTDEISSAAGANQVGFNYAAAYSLGTVGRWLKDLALSTGANFIGANDGAAGVNFTSVAGFIAYILSSAGSSILGFIQAGVGAVSRTMQSKARDTLHVRDFGVVGNGIVDDYVNCLKAITAAYALNQKITLDFNGCNVGTTLPFQLPAGGNVSFKNGKISALASFPAGRYVIEANSQASGLCNHDLEFDLVIDANHLGGCLVIDNYIRVRIAGTCRFLHFNTDGVYLKKTIDSHEGTIDDGCSAFEYLYGEAGYLAPTATSVGFRIDSFDNSIGAVVSYYTGKGMILNGQFNQVSKPHLGGIAYGLHITMNASFSSVFQPYIDSAAILWENPWNTEIIGGKFLANTAVAAFSFIVLKPMSAGIAVNGLKIKNCSFYNINAVTVNSITVDTSVGTISAALVQNCYIGENSFVRCVYAYTKFTSSLFQAASTVWTFNVGAYLPFGNIQLAKHSFYDASNVKPASNISSIVGNTVQVTNSIAGNGTVFLEVDVNTGTS